MKKLQTHKQLKLLEGNLGLDQYLEEIHSKNVTNALCSFRLMFTCS